MPNQDQILVAEGDSWFDLPDDLNNKTDNVLEGLKKEFKYTVKSVAQHGDTLASMASAKKQHKALDKELGKLKERGKKPKAILLSGGGNDLVYWLSLMLNSCVSTSPTNVMSALNTNNVTNVMSALNTNNVQLVICNHIRACYSLLIEVVRKTCAENWGQSKIPIIVHGYGHPVPDGRHYKYLIFKKGPWLEPVFKEKGYASSELYFATQVMKVLIDKFNRMLCSLETNYDNVCYVDVRGLLSNKLDKSDSRYYKKFWEDELHPKSKVFKCIAQKIHEKTEDFHSH